MYVRNSFEFITKLGCCYTNVHNTRQIFCIWATKNPVIIIIIIIIIITLFLLLLLSY
jgi:hypothetical protein